MEWWLSGNRRGLDVPTAYEVMIKCMDGAGDSIVGVREELF